MAQITAALIKEVRDATGAGMMDVKKALTEAEGDIARAKEIIRASGIKAAGAREGRKAQEGLIASSVANTAEGQTGYAVELNSGTVKDTIDEAGALFHEHVKLGQVASVSGPHVEVYAHRKSVELPPSIVAMVATDEAGAEVAHEVALQISAMAPQWLTREDVPADVVESEKRVATEKSLAEGKPEAIVPKIVEGRMNAFYKEVVLLEQAYVKDPSKTIGDLFKQVGGSAVAFARVEVGKGEDAE